MRKAAFLSIVICAALTASLWAQQQHNLPQVANGEFAGGRISTTFVLVNNGTSSAEVEVTLFGSAGEPFEVTIPGLGTASAFQLSLGPGETQFHQTDGTGGLQVGAARVTSTSIIGAAAILTIFDSQDNVVTEAGVGSAETLRAFGVAVDASGDFNTGVAIHNLSSEDATVTFTLFDEGNAQQGDPVSRDLPGNGHLAEFVAGELFPAASAAARGLPGGFQGKLVASSTTDVAAVSLRQNVSSFSLTTLPVVPEGVEIQFLNISDWHGQLDPLSVFGVGEVGGAAVINFFWAADTVANPNTIKLTAGDAFGAAPPLSGFFEERPAVMAMNLMGLDVDTFGNHNFDRGIGHLQQMIDLAEFQYVSANLANLDENLTGVKPFEIFERGGIRIAVVGITNPDVPELVFPGRLGTIEVTDPVAGANKAKADARAAGAQVIVAITHLGVTGFDEEGNPSGPLIDFANDVGGFDVIFGDHTDMRFSGIINNALVVENQSKGRTYARTKLLVNPLSGRVLDRSVQFVEPFADQAVPDQAILDLLEPFRDELAAEFDAVIGVANDTFERGGGVERLGEVPIGNLVADALRDRYGSQLAFTNGGGIRTPLPSSFAPMDMSLRRPLDGYAPGPPWDLVVGDVFGMLPFGNVVVTRPVTGAQLFLILENGVSVIPKTSGRFAQISGFSFVYDSSQPVGSRVVSVELDGGALILPDGTTYTLATNDFVNAGGDGYTMLVDGQGVSRENMADVVLEFIQELGVITPTTEGRIVDQNQP